MVKRMVLVLLLVLVLVLPVERVAGQEQCYSGTLSGGFLQTSLFVHLPGLSAQNSTSFFLAPGYEMRLTAGYPPFDITHRHAGDTVWRSISLNTWHQRLYESSSYLIGAVSGSGSFTLCTRSVPTATATPTAVPTATATATATPTATAVPTATAIPTVVAVAATFDVVTDTQWIADRVVELASDGAPEQEIFWGYAALILGFIVIIGLAALLRGGE